MAKEKQSHNIDSIKHTEDKRLHIPSAEHQPIMTKADQKPIPMIYERRNRDLDPQLVWRGKDEQDKEDLYVPAPPLYIQERVHSKVLIDDLLKQTESRNEVEVPQLDLFSDFNGLPSEEAKTEFYQHDSNWSNRMILGDSLQVMASLTEREGLRGKVQCIYFDPPYGIKFNSNFQWSTTSRNVKDGKKEHITREPEQVKAFRDTWKDGIHSYLSYLRDRLTVSRDMLTDSGSIFVQIGDENVHRVRTVMDEVFGDENFVSLITLQKTGGLISEGLVKTLDYICWYSKDRSKTKIRQIYKPRQKGDTSLERYDQIRLESGEFRKITKDERISGIYPKNSARCRPIALESANPIFDFSYRNKKYSQKWKTNITGLERLSKSDRIYSTTKRLNSVRYVNDFPVIPLTDRWDSMQIGTGLIYVVQTAPTAVQNCILMSTDPGDLVLDPTCGSGTAAYVAEQWGRRWITIDTSRVAMALARSRIMGARYPYYLLADSKEGQLKESVLTRSAPSSQPVSGNIRYGFVYERVPHVTLKSIANNIEIDVIWEKFQKILDPLREQLNEALNQNWEEWNIPYDSLESWPLNAKELHNKWLKNQLARQKEIDASIASKADYEYLYDKPYEDKKTVRVAGPFTVESVSPHRYLGVDEHEQVIDPLDTKESDGGTQFVQMILENLKSAGIQQAHKEDKIRFNSLNGWPGDMICAEGRYDDGISIKRAGIFIGPEFGTVSRQDLVVAAREAGDAEFDVLVSCAFNYEAHVSELKKLGRIPVLKARMNADLHMAEDLKNTGKGNLFVIFGEPDIDIQYVSDTQIKVEIHGIDVFDPKTGEVRSDDKDGIACWFIDTDYNEESFFVRHSYFLGANDPYKSLKTSLKAEIDIEAWESLHSSISRSFRKPKSGRIAVKVINHLGDEVMKVFRVE